MDSTRPANGHTGTRSFVGSLLLTLVGPIAWSAHFLVVYQAHAMICARSGSARSAEFLVAVATLAALAGLAWVAVRTPVKAFGGVAQTRQFLRRIMLLLALLSAIGISWAGAAMIVLPACLSLR